MFTTGVLFTTGVEVVVGTFLIVEDWLGLEDDEEDDLEEDDLEEDDLEEDPRDRASDDSPIKIRKLTTKWIDLFTYNPFWFRFKSTHPQGCGLKQYKDFTLYFCIR